MASKGGTGTTRNGRDSRSKRLGVKLFGGQNARTGSIIVRQRGTKFVPGSYVRRAHDDSLYALCEGVVTFRPASKKGYTGIRRTATVISITPHSKPTKQKGK